MHTTFANKQRPVLTATTVDEERSYSVNTSPPPVLPEMVDSPTTSSSKLTFSVYEKADPQQLRQMLQDQEPL